MVDRALDWIKEKFTTAAFTSVPLEFEVDLDEKGRSAVTTYALIEGKKKKVHKVAKIWSYGAVFRHNGRKYVIARESQEMLFSMRSLNPTFTSSGEMVFQICPPVLRYLRIKENLSETTTAKKIQIQETPLEPTAKIDFDPEQGAVVKTGYSKDGDQSLISKDELELSSDGDYARFGDTFAPLPSRLTREQGKWLERGETSIPLARVPEFFQRDLVLVKSNFKAVLTDEANKVRVVRETIVPKITVHPNEPGWLDFKVDYLAGEFVLPEELIRATPPGQPLRADPYTFVEADRTEADQCEKGLKELNPIKTAEGYRLPVDRFASLEDFIETIGGIREVSMEYERFLERISGFESNEEFELSSTLEEGLASQDFHLRPYQRSGIQWLCWLRDHYLHGILADDMGLGKTVQTVLAVALSYETGKHAQHSLVVCPKSVIHHWTREFERFAPNLQTYEYIGTSRRRGVLHSGRPIVFVTTYDTARSDFMALSAVPFLYLVLDEATRIKNPEAQRTQAIKSLNAIHRLTLTGTPIENRAEELWSQFDFLMKGHLGKYGTFSRMFGDPLAEGDSGTSERLAKRIRPFILRRKKEEVAKDLPEKIDITEWCELTEEQSALYGQIQERYAAGFRKQLESGETVNSISILGVLTKLKQVCDHPALILGETEPVLDRSEKFDLALDKILEIREKGEQVVVFSHFLKMLDLLESELSRRGVVYVRVDGSTSDRQSKIDRFNGGSAGVALCSLQAMGVGVNLQSANHVIHVDRWWNPAVEDQATDRVHRIGQVRRVYVYKILVTGTLEEKIELLQKRKRLLADNVIDAATHGPQQWSREELLEILQPMEH